jgi:hypothetical protein
MSQKLSSDEPRGEPSWEEAVARHLEEHPDFFERHAALLARLKVTHAPGGPAVSLIERQVQVLREQEQALGRQLRELVAIARENDVLGQRLHRFALAMLEAHSLDDVLDTAEELLRQEFRLDAVVIRVRGRAEGAHGRAEFVTDEQRALGALLGQLGDGKPLCGARHDEALLRYLYGERAAQIRSSALIPLGAKTARGVLALGSQDPQRFHPGMGTVYLARLGELLMQGLLRYLR